MNDPITNPDVFALAGLAYNDVLLLPRLTDIVPSEVNTTSGLTPRISPVTPLLSATMDAATESDMVTIMARQGDIGILRRNLFIEDRAQQVRRIKRSESGMVADPVAIGPDASIIQFDELYGHYEVPGLSVVDAGGNLQGITTNRDLRFVPPGRRAGPTVREYMTSRGRLVAGEIGISQEGARALLAEYHIRKLPLVGAGERPMGLITVKDFVKTEQYPHVIKDAERRLVMGAAVGCWEDTWERAGTLAETGVDVLAVDTTNGGAELALGVVFRLKSDSAFGDIEVVDGGVVTRGGAQALTDAGADAVEVGVGPGSIYTTRVIAGVGVPQVTAICEATRACRSARVPLITGGGLQHSGGITEALVVSAEVAILGSLLAGHTGSPDNPVFINGEQWKRYHGMGPLGAMSSRGHTSYSRNRYFQADVSSDLKIVPEDIEGQIPYSGVLGGVVYQLMDGLRQSTFYVSTRTIPKLKGRGQFVWVASAGLRESHPHDIKMTVEAPSYTGRDGF